MNAGPPTDEDLIVLYHDGCNVCQRISSTMTAAFAAAEKRFESVDLSVHKSRAAEAQALGITRLPSLLIKGEVLRLEDHSPIEHYV